MVVLGAECVKFYILRDVQHRTMSMRTSTEREQKILHSMPPAMRKFIRKDHECSWAFGMKLVALRDFSLPRTHKAVLLFSIPIAREQNARDHDLVRQIYFFVMERKPLQSGLLSFGYEGSPLSPGHSSLFHCWTSREHINKLEFCSNLLITS